MHKINDPKYDENILYDYGSEKLIDEYQALYEDFQLLIPIYEMACELISGGDNWNDSVAAIRMRPNFIEAVGRAKARFELSSKHNSPNVKIEYNYFHEEYGKSCLNHIL